MKLLMKCEWINNWINWNENISRGEQPAPFNPPSINTNSTNQFKKLKLILIYWLMLNGVVDWWDWFGEESSSTNQLNLLFIQSATAWLKRRKELDWLAALPCSSFSKEKIFHLLKESAAGEEKTWKQINFNHSLNWMIVDCFHFSSLH